MKVRHIDFYADEWLAGTVNLSAEERGIYITICSLVYSHGGPIPNDESRLCQACNMHWRAYRAAAKRLQDLGKIVSKDGHVWVKRCLKELQKARKRASSARQNGVKGGRPRKETNGLAKPNGFSENKPGGSGGGKPDEKLTTNLPTTNLEVRTDASASVERASAPSDQPDATTLPRAGPKNARKSRIPADCIPDEQHCRYAAERGYGPEWVIEEFAKFRDCHLAKGSAFADWQAAWRTWVQRAEQFAGATGRGRVQSGSIAAAMRTLSAHDPLV